jgi:hypothetical protein
VFTSRPNFDVEIRWCKLYLRPIRTHNGPDVPSTGTDVLLCCVFYIVRLFRLERETGQQAPSIYVKLSLVNVVDNPGNPVCRAEAALYSFIAKQR